MKLDERKKEFQNPGPAFRAKSCVKYAKLEGNFVEK